MSEELRVALREALDHIDKYDGGHSYCNVNVGGGWVPEPVECTCGYDEKRERWGAALAASGATLDAERLAEAMHMWRNHEPDGSEDRHLTDHHQLGDSLRAEARGTAAMYARLSGAVKVSGSDDPPTTERESDRLREALVGMTLKWAPHSGACCTFDEAGQVTVTRESCVCGPVERAAQEALEVFGRPDEYRAALSDQP